MDRISRSALLAFVGSTAAMVAPAFTSQALAQQASWAAARADGATLQCGPREGFYTVAELPAGSVLLVEGREGEWARVRYPRSLNPMVPAGEVRVIDASTVELTTASGLRAPSLLLGLAGSWRSVYPDKLPEGTRLSVVQKLTNAEGAVTGYSVVAPDPAAVGGRTATAYIRADQLRPATEAEIAAAGNAPSQPTAQPTTQPTAQPTGQPATQPVPPAAATTTTTPATSPAARPATTPAQPGTTSVPTPRPTTPAAEETGPRAAFNQGVMPVESGERIAPAEAGTIGGVPAAGLQQVDASFAEARALPTEQLDARLDELAAEYTRLRGLATDDAVAQSLDARLDWLRLRIATRDARRSLGQAVASSAGAESASAASIEQWRRSRGYGMVGRLLPSSVYDGRRLPQRYRLVSVDPVMGETTIGYIDPAADERLPGSVGLIIGVRGQTRFDEATRLRTIDISEMEVLGQNTPDTRGWQPSSPPPAPVTQPTSTASPTPTPTPTSTTAPATTTQEAAQPPTRPAPAPAGGAIVVEPL